MIKKRNKENNAYYIMLRCSRIAGNLRQRALVKRLNNTSDIRFILNRPQLCISRL